MIKHHTLFKFIAIVTALVSAILFIKTNVIYFLLISVVSLISSVYLFSAKDSDNAGSKLSSLEGLRGAASFIVVMDHFVFIFFPAMFFPLQYSFHYPIEKVIASTQLSVLYNGDLAVVIFFILSGFVLSFKFFQTKDKEIAISSFIKRYPRLTLPIVFSCLIGYLMLKFKLFSNCDLQPVTYSDWAAKLFVIHPNFLRAIYDAFLGVYVTWTEYDPVLWTMKIELLGSFLVFFSLFLFSYIKKRNIVYFILAALFCKSHFLCFIIGIIMADLYNSDNYNYFKNNLCLKFSTFALGLFFCTYPFFHTNNSVYKLIETTFSNVIKSGALLNHMTLILGATLFLHSILYSNTLNKFFSTNLMQFLGKISFSLYFTHLFIICSLSSYIFKFLINSYQYPYYLAFWVSFAISMPVIIILAYLTYIYIDANSVKFSKIFYEKIKLHYERIKDKLTSTEKTPTLKTD